MMSFWNVTIRSQGYMNNMMKNKILLIHSGQMNGNGTRRLLDEIGYEVVSTGYGLTELTIARERDVDLILMDVVFPDMEGLDLCRRFRSRDDTRSIPIVLVVGRGYSPGHSISIAEAPDDYLSKPFTCHELGEKISAVLHSAVMKHRTAPEPAPASGTSLRSMPFQEMTGDPAAPSTQRAKAGIVRYLRPVSRSKIAPASQQDEQQPSQIIPFSGTGATIIDPATGLFGRTQFEAMFSKVFKQAVRFKQQMSCLLISLEGQDREHTVDEAMVKAIISLVQKTIREVDTAAWWSGESFIVLLPNTIRSDALQAGARILEAVASHALPDSTKVTVNIGVAGLPDHTIDTEKKLIESAISACKRAEELLVPPPANILAASHHTARSGPRPSLLSKRSA